MEEKAKREANVNTVGDQLHVPKPPEVPKIDTAVAAAVSPLGSASVFRGEEPRRGVDRGEESGRISFRGGSRGEDTGRISFRGGAPARGEDPLRSGMVPPMPLRPGVTGAAPAAPTVKIPTKEELTPEAKRIATQETARRIYTYIDDNSLEMHPIGSPSFVVAPSEVDMWAAQVFYWIEKDVIDALRRVNDQADVPEDQRWVAYLPVKHLVSLNISEYLGNMVTDVMTHATASAILHANSSGSSRSSSAPVSFGDRANAFTNRSRNEQYDVVHVAMNLVVDARYLPKVLIELCKQNLITPLDVQYRNVDVMTAREAGYLYGSGPVIDVDIVCEMLFYRSIYDAWKPEIVRKSLSGELAAVPAGG
jgi:hypothetical protein